MSHLKRTYPGFGLDQIKGGSKQDISKERLLGHTTLAWRGGDWTLEMAFNVIPEPDYESKLFHREIGVVWEGTFQSGGDVEPVQPLPSSTYDLGACDEGIAPEAADECAGAEFSAQDDAIDLEQNLFYLCCAEPVLSVGRDGDVKVIEANAGDVCHCWCGYPITATLTDLASRTYIVEVWGVQDKDVAPVNLLASTKLTIP